MLYTMQSITNGMLKLNFVPSRGAGTGSGSQLSNFIFTNSSDARVVNWYCLVKCNLKCALHRCSAIEAIEAMNFWRRGQLELDAFN